MEAAGKGSRTTGEVVHHDLVLQTVGKTDNPVNLQLEFLKRGLDPNDGWLGGRYLLPEFHRDVIHGGQAKEFFNHPGGAWNYQWERFFARNANASSGEVLEFLDVLVGLTSDHGVLSWRDVDWPFPPGK